MINDCEPVDIRKAICRKGTKFDLRAKIFLVNSRRLQKLNKWLGAFGVVELLFFSGL